MDARLTDEQLLLQETVAALAQELAPRTTASLPPADDGAGDWKRLAELDLTALRIPERWGGLEASAVEAGLCAEQLARFLVPLPFVGSALLATQLLVAAGADRALLESLRAGALRLAPVLDPELARLAAPGEPGIAWDARGAGAGLALDPHTRRLHAVELGAPRRGADLTRALREVAPGARRADLGDMGDAIAADAAQRTLALALAALAADLVGSMQAALDAALAHVRQREQFGGPVGAFQAVQHLAADALVSLEAARSCAWYGLWAVDALAPAEALLAARTAKAAGSEYGREVCEAQIQLLGGVGMTWEYPAHLHLRRALVSRQTLGDEHAQYDAIAQARLGAAGS